MLENECPIADIPKRLHRGSKPVRPSPEGDSLYIRHIALPPGEGYALEIPGYRLEDQSANSETLNQGGRVCDVLYNTEGGPHWLTNQVARIDASELRSLKLPNPNTLRYDRMGRIIQKADVYTFEVKHEPTPCMYPHCEIVALKNGVRGSISNSMKSTIRSQMARLAERFRQTMLEIVHRELPILQDELAQNSPDER